MEDKRIGFIMMIVVLVLGMFAVINMASDATGATVLQKRQCCCEITRFDFYGNPTGTEIHPITVRSAEAWNDASCSNRCDIMFGKKYNDATGKAC